MTGSTARRAKAHQHPAQAGLKSIRRPLKFKICAKRDQRKDCTARSDSMRVVLVEIRGSEVWVGWLKMEWLMNRESGKVQV